MSMHVRVLLFGGAALAAFAFAACSGAGSGASVAPGTFSARSFARPDLERRSLYVANKRTSTISVYEPLGNTPVRTVTEGVVAPTSILFDAKDDLYVGNGRFGDTGGVVVYGPLSTRILRHLQPREPIAALAMDAAGNLYAGRVRGGVEVYAPGAESPSRTITAAVRNVGALAVDSKGNLYVLNSLQQFSQTGTEINVFAPGGSTSIRQYKFPVTEEPLSMAFDAADNLYVGIKSTKQFTTGQVDFYEAGNPDLRGRYVELAVPAAVALDKTDHLYVADSRRNDVYVYVPHQRTLARRLTDDLDGPASLAFDTSGNVYVGNSIGNSVTVYSAGKKTLAQTITKGVADPVAIAFGP